MAGSRLDRIGTLFSRSSGLLRSGAVKYQDRPLWYDVYRVFPPKYEPHFDRKPERTTAIPDILYKEDTTRAAFFRRFGINPSGEVRHLNDLTFEETSQSFVKQVQEIGKHNPEWSPDQVFEAAADAYQASRPVYSTRSTAGGRTNRRESSQSISQTFKEDSNQEVQEPLIIRERKTPLITPESLKSLFQEAKAKQSLEKETQSETESSSADFGENPKDSKKS